MFVNHLLLLVVAACRFVVGFLKHWVSGGSRIHRTRQEKLSPPTTGPAKLLRFPHEFRPPKCVVSLLLSFLFSGRAGVIYIYNIDILFLWDELATEAPLSIFDLGNTGDARKSWDGEPTVFPCISSV